MTEILDVAFCSAGDCKDLQQQVKADPQKFTMKDFFKCGECLSRCLDFGYAPGDVVDTSFLLHQLWLDRHFDEIQKKDVLWKR